ncbi:hypothetical protein [Alistipes indistinctus]|uniref:hypothetical protein n=1 Tax=Alistipes indistinctus TaxID=626932 RepID=UPI0026746DCA|nr:hypothetical protein [Alistipes indistinctus]
MKPILVIDDACAATLFRRLSEFIGAPVSAEFLDLMPPDVMRIILARILDICSETESHETDRA